MIIDQTGYFFKIESRPIIMENREWGSKMLLRYKEKAKSYSWRGWRGVVVCWLNENVEEFLSVVKRKPDMQTRRYFNNIFIHFSAIVKYT